MKVPDYAVVTEGEVFQVGDELDAWLTFVLHRALEAQDATGVLLGLVFLLGGVEDHEDEEVLLFSGFLHVSLHVLLVEATIGEDDGDGATDAPSYLRLRVLVVQELVGVAHEVGHGVVVA